MRKDFDYVAIDDYRKDMESSATLAGEIITDLNKKLTNSTRILIAIVRKYGEIFIDKEALFDEEGEIIQEEYLRTNTIKFSYIKE